MAYGRAVALAGSVLKRTAVGGAVGSAIGAVSGILGGGAPADRAASLRLRALGKQALAGDTAARDRIFEMAAKQQSKFGTINAAAVRWAEKLRANAVPGMNGASATTGAGPIGIMAPGGGSTGATRTSIRRRRVRRTSARRPARARRRGRRMSALQRKYFGKRRRSRR